MFGSGCVTLGESFAFSESQVFFLYEMGTIIPLSPKLQEDNACQILSPGLTRTWRPDGFSLGV